MPVISTRLVISPRDFDWGEDKARLIRTDVPAGNGLTVGKKAPSELTFEV